MKVLRRSFLKILVLDYTDSDVIGKMFGNSTEDGAGRQVNEDR